MTHVADPKPGRVHSDVGVRPAYPRGVGSHVFNLLHYFYKTKNDNGIINRGMRFETNSPLLFSVCKFITKTSNTSRKMTHVFSRGGGPDRRSAAMAAASARLPRRGGAAIDVRAQSASARLPEAWWWCGDRCTCAIGILASGDGACAAVGEDDAETVVVVNLEAAPPVEVRESGDRSTSCCTAV